MTDFPPGQGRKDALLIATGTYDDGTLGRLRSPAQDCAGLEAVLADPRIGGFRTQRIEDAPAHRTMRAIESFFRDRGRDDLLLLHLSCHGIKDEDGRLHFAARDTDRDLPASTAVPAAFLRERMERCRARTVVLLLDCCYSGAFLPGAKGDDRIPVRDELGGHGRAVLTATSRTEYAWEGEHIESTVPQPSLFTGALIEGLRTGAADLNGDGRITVTEWYDYVYESLHRAGARQRPRMWAELEYQVTIARAVPGSGPGPGAGEPGGPDPAEAGIDTGARREEDTYPRPRRQRGRDTVLPVEFELRETALGTIKEIAIDTKAVCPGCSGSGAARGSEPEECGGCGGCGERRETSSGHRGDISVWVVCAACRGHGTVLPETCPECRGDGRVESGRTLEFLVPAGIEHGTRMQLTGEGEAGPGGGPAGDLYVEIVQLPHSTFERIGDDLHCILTLPHAASETETTVTLDTLDGEKTIRVPAGVRDGQTLRLANRGTRHLTEDGRGHILVHIELKD
ncbi:DnaJ C-terminal domain-containing protein [Streptomyces sp. NPDC096198]|uniref:caspase, EACC1-associated type n=1 Tax=Streptomyces sp. NPDC096198 TaxID=3366080 RepID=UPI0038002D4A